MTDDGKITRIRAILQQDRGDDLERAKSAFRGMSAEQMQEPHGNSGMTRQRILDCYIEARKDDEEILEFFENLVAGGISAGWIQSVAARRAAKAKQ